MLLGLLLALLLIPSVPGKRGHDERGRGEAEWRREQEERQEQERRQEEYEEYEYEYQQQEQQGEVNRRLQVKNIVEMHWGLSSWNLTFVGGFEFCFPKNSFRFGSIII